MGLWVAIPESKDGSWFDEPIGANSENEAHEIAQRMWAGKLPPGVDVMVYMCSQLGQVVMPHAPAGKVKAEDVRGILKRD